VSGWVGAPYHIDFRVFNVVGCSTHVEFTVFYVFRCANTPYRVDFRIFGVSRIYLGTLYINILIL